MSDHTTRITLVQISGPQLASRWARGAEMHLIEGDWDVTVDDDGTLLIQLPDTPDQPGERFYPDRKARTNQVVRYSASAWTKYAVYTREIEGLQPFDRS